MRAARLHGYGEAFAIEEVPDPEPGAGEVVVRVLGAGVCHSDLHLASGEMGLAFPPEPWLMGHENAGIVESIGPGVTGVELGEPVAVFGGWGCGACRLCLGGEEQLCNVVAWCGIGTPGGYAQLLRVPAARHLVRLGDLDPVLAAPLTDAGLTPYRAVKKALARLVGGSVVLVVGVGGLGHLGVQLLRHLSAATIVAVDPLEAKRTLALASGADVALDPATCDVAAEVRARSGGEGAAAVLDFVGSDDTLATSLAAVGRRGLVVLVGLAGGTAAYSFFATAGEAEVTTSLWGTRNELAEVLALARAGVLRARVERYRLDQINEAFDRLRAGEVDGRAVVLPQE
jgi:propanol-preferring alcohol dehydrogenase